MSSGFSDMSIAEAGKALRNGSLTSRDLVEQTLGGIAAANPDIHAFITVTDDLALRQADAADAAFARGEDKGPMQGIPYALKDIYLTRGVRSTCNSRLLHDSIPDHDSFIGERLTASGAVLVGKTVTHEFAIGGPSLDSFAPPARNPWNNDHFAGGSSSGSAAAVAQGLVRLAMGSDTGGSIRGPAALCGVVGLKPSYGLLSRRGIFPLSYTLDHAGPIAGSVEDCAIALQTVAGHDPLDPRSANVAEADFVGCLAGGVAGMKIGLVRGFYEDDPNTDPAVIAAIEDAGRRMRDLGATVEDVALPDYDLFHAVGWTILHAEAYAVHEGNMQARPYEYGLYAYSRIAAGAFVPASELMQALRVRQKLIRKLNNEIFANYDGLLTACALAAAMRLDKVHPTIPPGSPAQCVPFNVTGNPAISMPAGTTAEGLPLSIQFVGRLYEDAKLLRIAAAYEGTAPAFRSVLSSSA